MKTIVFGLLIGMISCFQGVHATGGSRAPQPFRGSGLSFHHSGGRVARSFDSGVPIIFGG
jgi:hypothetical protein